MVDEKNGNPALWRRLLHWLLHLPVFYKILIANSALIVLWATGGMWVLRHAFGYLPWGASAIVAFIVAMVASILINSALIRLALTPLEALAETMNRVAAGDFQVRATVHPLGGKHTNACVVALNRMLAVLEEERQRSSSLTKQVISAQEEERKRVARELHDETSQVLASLTLGLEKLKLTMPNSFPQCMACQTDVNRLKGLTDRALIELHRLAFNLRPSILDDMGLRPALSWLFQEQLERKGIKVRFTWDGPEAHLQEEIEISVFRIVQEALTNIVKYAQASTVDIHVKRMPERLEIQITDDGIGFDMDTLGKNSEQTFGLLGMRERVALLKGSFELRSASGRGTAIALSLPIGTPGALEASKR